MLSLHCVSTLPFGLRSTTAWPDVLAQLNQTVAATLESVRLGRVAHKRAGKFSGGMKRRLSVAISLIGSPEVIADSCACQVAHNLAISSTTPCT
jgi:ABC-type branched-subunit amino acid transport system ATPase component